MLKPKTTHKTADLARWTRARYLRDAGDRSPTRVMMTVNTGRMKVLQMTILLMMRAMRSVFREVLPASRMPLSSPQASHLN
jgi:hypothetical protein